MDQLQEGTEPLPPVEEIMETNIASSQPVDAEVDDTDEFPVAELSRLDDMISNPRWVVPVLPGGQLEVLLESAINLAKKGADDDSPPCASFIRDGLTTSFNKILTDDAVSSWKPDIHKCILRNSERLVDLIVLKLESDNLALLELLAVLFNPQNKFHSFNCQRQPESYNVTEELGETELFARPTELRMVKGWLVDLINRFGSAGGFDRLVARFRSPAPLSVATIFALIRPFSLCVDFLSRHTVETYFAPIIAAIPPLLSALSDEELKKETGRSDLISTIIKSLKSLQSRLTFSSNANTNGLTLSAALSTSATVVEGLDNVEGMRTLEIFRLKMILRMLQISSFNGKMAALNEINQVIVNVTSHYASHSYRHEELEYLTAKMIAEWLAENKVLQIVLRDSLHQPQYVEKLEKILRFIIKEKSLGLSDLDDIWAAQVGKHDAIVKNVHDLLAKLAWDFSPDQLDHLFECFQASWTLAANRQREKLLELIRRLAEDDKDGVMAFKVLTLFWNLAHSNEVPTEIMDQALAAHVKVLDYSCSQQRDNHKLQWLNKSIDHLVADDVVWVLPAMKHIREIFLLYPEGSSNKNPTAIYRHAVVNRIQNDRQLIVKLCDSLNSYMDKVRAAVKERGPIEAFLLKLDGRYSHVEQIRERLTFLKFLLKEGQLWLCEDQANLIWTSLCENPAYPSDREMGFEWFSKLMGDDPDIDPNVTLPFFEGKILNFDATLLTDAGLECFERFFRNVNIHQKKLINKRDEVLMDDLELTGTDYIWRIILSGGEDLASRAIGFLRSIFTALGPKLIPNQAEVHEDFLSSCMDRLKASYDTMKVLEKDKDSTNRVRQEVTRAVRVLRVLFEYIVECDADYGEERAFIPLYRAARGKNLSVFIRFPGPTARNFEDVEIPSHTNETPLGLRRQMMRQLKDYAQLASQNFKLDVYYNGESIDLSDDKRTVQQFGLRDKMMLQAKIVQNNVINSPDSSEESSGGSPSHFPGVAADDGPNAEAEEVLPSVLISSSDKRMEFLCQLCGLGASIGEERLRDGARLLLSVLPRCRWTEACLRDSFIAGKSQYSMLFNTEPAVVLYRLEVLYTLLFPATAIIGRDPPPGGDLLVNFFTSGGASMVVEMLTKNNFMPLADVQTKRSAYLAVLKLTKSVLTVAACLTLKILADSSPPGDERVRILSEAAKSVPHPTHEASLRHVAEHVAKSLQNFLKTTPPEGTGSLRSLMQGAVGGTLPDTDTIRLLIRLASCTAAGSLTYFSQSEQAQQANREPIDEDGQLCEEALENLTLSFILNPTALETLIGEGAVLKTFLRQVLFYTQGRSIRFVANEQFYAIATKATGKPAVISFFIHFLLEMIQNVREHPGHSRDSFHLLCNLLRYSANYHIPLQKHEELLAKEIEWLRSAKDFIKDNATEGSFGEELLEGHICVARELTGFLSPEKKYELGCDPTGNKPLIKEILEEFVFPWSKAFREYKSSGEISSDSTPLQICSLPITQNSILELVSSLCAGTVQNMALTTNILSYLFGYGTDEAGPNEWEYIPPVGNRPIGGFVGLKNAGATCYMNSVLQQLFMVESIKRGLLGVELNGEETEKEGQEGTDGDERKNYNITILRQLQNIFGHLALSKLQYHTPSGLWKHFRLQGEAVNPREQQDAVEFFMSLVESVDDGLKALGHPQIMSSQLGGLFSDQKICKGCPHRYSKEEPFCVISVDIRNHSNLPDSLEQYVKGELLEGADAYHCERCNKKVVTVKRLCVKRLPPVLAIQLKRFEYDYERLCPLKFNDYFEFPRELDMEPYTAAGLAKLEGEAIEGDDDAPVTSHYRLSGVVVHSGQASGGHYYSYISLKGPDGIARWYKFDDGEVSECRIEDDEELKNQCFGGDYSGEIFDHMVKRMSFRRQKRWWNAYILFYTQTDPVAEQLPNKMSTLSLADSRLTIPGHIERAVIKQNVEFMHVRAHYSLEYFSFIKRLVQANIFTLPHYPAHALTPLYSPPHNSTNASVQVNEDVERLGLCSVELAANFLFTLGLRTKKNLRGPANEWFEILLPYLKLSKTVRFSFASHALFKDPTRIGEYLLECPSSEIRVTFSKILIALAHLSRDDGAFIPSHPVVSLSRSTVGKELWEFILESVINLLRRDVSEYGRNLVQYFGFFVSYAKLGEVESKQLLHRDVAGTFMSVALEDGPAPPIKYQCADLSKLYSAVSLLVRALDMSSRTKSSDEGPLRPNPWCTAREPFPLSHGVAESLFGTRSYSPSPYIKKILEDAYGAEDTLELFQFLAWENMTFSQMMILEILSRLNFTYTVELKTLMEVLMTLLKLQDSWQMHRLTVALKGLPNDDKEGLFDIIEKNKTSHPKKAYLFVKVFVLNLDKGSVGHRLLGSSPELGRKWNQTVEWLHSELERRGPVTSYAYSTSSWSPPSNEVANGSFFLERSLSAKHTLERAADLRITPQQEEELEEDGISSEGESDIGIAITCNSQSHTQLEKPSLSLSSSEPSTSAAVTSCQPTASTSASTSTGVGHWGPSGLCNESLGGGDPSAYFSSKEKRMAEWDLMDEEAEQQKTPGTPN